MTIEAHKRLQQELVSYMTTSPELAGEDEFNRLALELYRYQYEGNAPFRAYCRRQGKSPRMAKSWRDIPAVPIQAFKHSTLSTNAPEQAEAIFMTSGTTDPQARGKHYHPSLAVYDLSMSTAFRQYVMQERSRMRMGILFLRPDELPNSSLAHYLSLAVREFGSENSQYLVRDGVINLLALHEWITDARRAAEPVMLLGATFSFIHAMDAAGDADWRLPAGSQLLDTGGIKGRSRDMEPDTFYKALEERFAVDRSLCLNMYGMTELSTQYYDAGNAQTPAWKSGPHWIRPRTIDPLTGADVPPGERGILVHCDLANWNAVTTILTEDVAILDGDGRHFQLLGRAEGSEARGCSLAAESFRTAAGTAR